MSISFEPTHDGEHIDSDPDHSSSESSEIEIEVTEKIVKPRQDCIESGQRLLSALSQRLVDLKSNPNTVEDAAITRPLFELGGYHGFIMEGEEQPYTCGSEVFVRMETAFRDLNLDEDTTLVRATVYSNSIAHAYTHYSEADSNDSGEVDVVGITFLSQAARDGLIVIAYYNMKDNNLAPADIKIEHWSDLLFQVMKKVYYDDVPDIKYILIDCISNVNTMERIAEAHHHHPEKVSNWKGTFDPESSDPREVETCQSIVGCPNGVSVPYLLMDYPATFRQKKIVRIHTWSKDWIMALAFEFAPSE